MKILHICTGFPLSFQGGITNYVRTIAQGQFENGYDVWVMGAPDTEQFDFRYYEYSSGIKNTTYGRLKDKNALQKIKQFLEREKFDLIHIHLTMAIDWDLYQIIAPYHYIVSLHDYYYLCPRVDMVPKKGEVCGRYDADRCKRCISYLHRFGACRFALRKGNAFLHRDMRMPYVPQKITEIRHDKFMKLLNGADYLLPVSKRVEEIYKDSGATAKSKVLHIGNISADNFRQEYTYNTNPHKIKIAFLGRLSYSKGADLFIRIAENLDQSKYEVHFLGRPGEYVNKMKACGIINHGMYKQEDLSKILEEYDLGMILSVWEDNGPQVVMELLNNHVPVIGTRMGGIPDFVNESNGYVFDPYSEKEFAELLHFMDTLTIERIAQMKRNITPTKTTEEHFQDVMNVYRKIYPDM